MFGWLKRKHIHEFTEKSFSSVITLYEEIRFESCKCGLERIKRIHFQGPNEGKVEIEYLQSK